MDKINYMQNVLVLLAVIAIYFFDASGFALVFLSAYFLIGVFKN